MRAATVTLGALGLLTGATANETSAQENFLQEYDEPFRALQRGGRGRGGKRGGSNQKQKIKQTKKVMCHFMQATDIWVSPGAAVNFAPVIKGDTDNIQTSWTCQFRGKPCEEVDTSSTAETLDVPADVLVGNGAYKFTMKVNKDDKEIGECSQTVNIDGKTYTEQPMIMMKGNKSQKNVDPNDNLTAKCSPMPDMAENPSLSFDLDLKEVGSNKSSTQFAEEVQGGIKVDKEFFSSEKEYEFTCLVRDADNAVVGKAVKVVNTKEAKDSTIKFDVQPAKGTPFETEFTFSVKKDADGEDLQCVFSYENKVKKTKKGSSNSQAVEAEGRVTIEDTSEVGAALSSSDQSVVSTLPEPATGRSIMAHVECTDALGEVRRGKKNIPMNVLGSDGKKKGKDSAKAKIRDSLNKGDKVRTSDIVQLNEASRGDRDVDSMKEMARAIKSKKMLSQMDEEQLTAVMTTITADLAALDIETIDNDAIDEAVDALIALIDSKKTAKAAALDEEGELEDETVIAMDEETFDQLVGSLDDLMEVQKKEKKARKKSKGKRKEQQEKIREATDAIVEEGIARVSADLQFGEGVSDKKQKKAKKSMKWNNIAIDILKIDKETFKENKKEIITVMKDAIKSQRLEVSVPFDEGVFGEAEGENVVISVMTSDSRPDDETLQEQQGATLVDDYVIISDIVDVSAQASDAEVQDQNDLIVEDIEVEDLAEPIIMKIPLDEEYDPANPPTCMYLDTDDDRWVDVKTQCAEGVIDDTDLLHFECCSDHLTSFTVMQIKSGAAFMAAGLTTLAVSLLM